MLSKYSFPEVFRDLLETALEAEVLDPTELYLLGMGISSDLPKAVDIILDTSKRKVKARKLNHENVKLMVKAFRKEYEAATKDIEETLFQDEKPEGEKLH